MKTTEEAMALLTPLSIVYLIKWVLNQNYIAIIIFNITTIIGIICIIKYIKEHTRPHMCEKNTPKTPIEAVRSQKTTKE